MDETEKKKLIRSAFFPIVFVALIWAVKLTEIGFGISFSKYGLLPQTFTGLQGILTYPLIHGNLTHLISNSIPLLILGFITFYFYRTIAFAVFSWVYIMSGVWLWAAGRETYHIGASALVYGFVSFLFFSGIFRRDRRLMLLSLFVLFFYGTMIWGIFPIVPNISWEGHLFGSFAGIITSYFYRKEGPQREEHIWEDEDEKQSGLDNSIPPDINYLYTEKKETDESKN